MPNPTNRQIVGAAAATLAGLPIVAAAALRLKYGPTVFDDLAAIRRQAALRKTLLNLKQKNIKLVDFFEEHAKETPEKAFVLYKDEVHTYSDLDDEANKLACFVQKSGLLACKDTAAIFMLNEPNFVLSWLAFSKLGIRIALLNYSLKGEALLHCVKACKVKVIACGKDTRLVEALHDVMHELDALGVRVWVLGQALDHVLPPGMLEVNTWNERSDPIPRSVRDEVPNDDDAVYIFTSGTTGLPKPVKVTHTRQVRGSFVQAQLGLRKDDVIYTPLPLYHSSAYILGFANILRVGGTIVLSKFSARRFWDDVRKYRVTVIQYIGEICRYLLAQPPCQEDGKYSHKVRYAIGNGLAHDVWEAFQKRFNIDHMAEFYASTEGIYLTMNTDGKVGSVGRYHGIIKALTDVIAVVQCDLETAQPLRGPDGKCLITPPGEIGLMLLRVNDIYKFEGYLADKKANEKKLARNVKEIGDVFFNTGDLMIHDKDGYVYFKDRLGDTFRWKGENVATTEVAHVLNLYPNIQESNVYGVKVPGHNGRAGMAAIVVTKDQQLDMKNLFSHVVKSLPHYARPKFLRIMKEMDITGTFKHKKIDLAREGFDLNVISDPLYFMDVEKQTYVPLDSDVIRKVAIGQAKL